MEFFRITNRTMERLDVLYSVHFDYHTQQPKNNMNSYFFDINICHLDTIVRAGRQKSHRKRCCHHRC